MFNLFKKAVENPQISEKNKDGAKVKEKLGTKMQDCHLVVISANPFQVMGGKTGGDGLKQIALLFIDIHSQIQYFKGGILFTIKNTVQNINIFILLNFRIIHL